MVFEKKGLSPGKRSATRLLLSSPFAPHRTADSKDLQFTEFAVQLRAEADTLGSSLHYSLPWLSQ